MIRVCAFFVAVLAVLPLRAEDGFESLFNGKDLSGWAGDPELWSVEDGCITGKTKGPDHLKYNKFLIWQDGKVADFELRCEFRLEGKNNSGVQYRSRQDKERGDWVVVGYQADIHGNAEYTGMLYDEKGRGIIAKRGQKTIVTADGRKQTSKLDVPVEAVDLTEWHELTIIARGNQLTHKLDGVTTVEIIDNQEAEREMEGILALQVHRGPAMTAQFRNIRLKRFAAKKAAPKNAAAKKPAPKKKVAALPNPVWIWINEGDEPAQKVYFRKELDSSGVASARLVATADDSMTVYLDGKKILEHGSWERLAYADISKALDLDSPKKKHVLAIEAANGKSAAGLLAQIDLESGWRDAWRVVSDGSWRASTKAEKGWKTLEFDDSGWQKPQIIAQLGGGPWASKVTAATVTAAAPLKQPTATPIEAMKIKDGFNVELLYSVPKGEEGSWVNMCHDPKGRLIVSDQYGSLYRLTPPGILGATELQVEKINVDIGEAQGLLWAFDSLYVNVNRGQKYPGGLYRVLDTDGDDNLDTVKTLRPLNGSGEHGPHAVLPHPDGKSLVVICGNRTDLTEIDTSRVPRTWDEDLLLPRAQGKFMRGTRAPGGYICRIDPEGKTWELIASGFRNEFDGAFNADGELFTYDADMEWDLNTPWYRPTRICHVISGAEFGWRSGGGKWPVYYADSIPPVVDIGPGSPTGVVFGYGAKFPAKYQNAMFICDWSYGKMYAVHLEPNGSTYGAKFEEFITGTPLPLTDVIINPHDGAMYYLIGGRKVQSGLYKVTYSGAESTEKANPHQAAGKDARATRAKLEALHLGDHPNAVDVAWPHLGSDDRFIRYAARIAIEHRPRSEWQEKALYEEDPQAALTALLALARTFEREDKGTEPDIDSPAPDWSTAQAISSERAEVCSLILAALNRLDWSLLPHSQQLETLRVLSLTFTRVAPPSESDRRAIIDLGVSVLPAKSRELNSELATLLVYLQAPYAAEKIVALLNDSPTQEEQIDLAKTLRHLKTGWNQELRESYFRWFVRAGSYRGGASFALFVQRIREEALAHLSDEEKMALKPVLEMKPKTDAPVFVAEPRPVVKQWTMDELVPLVTNGLTGRDFDNGRKMFGAANCFACHRFDNQGGAVGPDLTSLSGRFSSRDILESVVDPSKQISDQYGSVQIITVDGKVITGRIVNLAGDSVRVQTNMLDPGALVGVDRKQIDVMLPSKTSMMPQGLLNTLHEDEVLDLMAYLLSRGDRSNAMFKQ
ncbi:MAG: family 16 glycoside hydrolase [Planctomycetota bacterium]